MRVRATCKFPGCGRPGSNLCPRDQNRLRILIEEEGCSKDDPGTWAEAWRRREERRSQTVATAVEAERPDVVAVSAETRKALESLGYTWGTKGGPVLWLMGKLSEVSQGAKVLEFVRADDEGLRALAEHHAAAAQPHPIAASSGYEADIAHQALRAALLRIVGEPTEDEVAAAGIEPLTDAELLTQVEHLVRRRRPPADLDETAMVVVRWQVAFLRSIAADLHDTWGFPARQVVIGLRSIADTLGSLVDVKREFHATAPVGVALG